MTVLLCVPACVLIFSAVFQTHVYNDVTYVYDDVTYVHDDVTYVYASLRLDLFRSLSNVLVAHVRFSGGLSVGHGTSLHSGSSNLCPDMCVLIYVSVYPFCGTRYVSSSWQ